MKTQFGSFWLRLFRGGVHLTPIEERLLRLFREHIPSPFHAALDAQFAAYNLAQRHVEWKGVNLYRIRRGKVVRDDLPTLPCSDGEVKLLALAVSPSPSVPPLHVMFWAVQKYFFGFGTGESLKPFRQASDLQLLSVKQSWRSNFAPEPRTSSPSGPGRAVAG